MPVDYLENILRHLVERALGNKGVGGNIDLIQIDLDRCRGHEHQVTIVM